ncbi:MAG: hypothetical protein KFF46_06775, partial [Desulfobacterales bacterium]|nr:hypothetical protein [Desulfobacterales bacterium]
PALILVFLAFMTAGCAGLPEIKPERPVSESRVKADCRAVFADVPGQVVHSMTARMPNDEVYQGISVTRVSPQSGRIKCVIMSIEGLVLFSGQANGDIRVERAIGPFESEKFAERLFADIRQVFLPPRGLMVGAGKNSENQPVCRYLLDDGGFLDVVQVNPNHSQIIEYSPGRKKTQTVSVTRTPAGSADEGGLRPADKIVIERHGVLGYQLDLERIEQNPDSATP